MSSYYGIFHPSEDVPIGQVFRTEQEAVDELARQREVVESFAGVPFGGPEVEATYGAALAEMYVARLT